MYQLARVSERAARMCYGIVADRRCVRIQHMVAKIVTVVATCLKAVAQIPGAGTSRIRDAVHSRPHPPPEFMNVCVCMCACMCIFVYVCIWIMYICRCVCVCVCVCVWVYLSLARRSPLALQLLLLAAAEG